MARILKYELEEGENQVVAPFMEILDIQLQGDLPVMWALVNTGSKLNRTVDIQMVWTGQEIAPDMLKEYQYIKTLQSSDGLVWHVFIKGI